MTHPHLLLGPTTPTLPAPSCWLCKAPQGALPAPHLDFGVCTLVVLFTGRREKTYISAGPDGPLDGGILGSKGSWRLRVEALDALLVPGEEEAPSSVLEWWPQEGLSQAPECRRGFNGPPEMIFHPEMIQRSLSIIHSY